MLSTGLYFSRWHAVECKQLIEIKSEPSCFFLIVVYSGPEHDCMFLVR